ncbi:uncharacterized protein LOC113147417 [Cyclospora cayetanensis]|uniref:Uncharacterized protein LOC113147417 n=1 Tax=Cyclospora cayetanensis TaxID=88456 RepID=A0A6P6S256_9EIME|nr:uncharacterized protein LOC113147417 [Cyclospora cayetanensis]
MHDDANTAERMRERRWGRPLEIPQCAAERASNVYTQHAGGNWGASAEEEAVRGEAMAQVPWEVLSRQPVEASAALKQLRLCYRSIRKAAAAAEGAATAQGVLQQEILGSLKTAHAALSEVLLAEAKEPAAEASLRRNACFEAVRIRFVPELDGVWLAFTETRPATLSSYSNVSKHSSSKSGSKGGAAALGFLLPDLHSNDGTLLLSVETTALVFTPKVGDLITCLAQTVRPAVVRLLWLGHFTAVVHREHLGARFHYQEECKAYVHHKDKSRRIEDKAFVRIHIIEVPKSHSGDRVAIRGSVLARGSGPLAPASVELSTLSVAASREPPAAWALVAHTVAAGL